MTPLTAESVAGGSVRSSTRVMICSSRGGAFGVWETSIDVYGRGRVGAVHLCTRAGLLNRSPAQYRGSPAPSDNRVGPRACKKPTSVECGVPPAEGGQPNAQAVADIEQLAG